MAMAGKVGLITGGAGGIGKAFAQVLLENGAKVCFVDMNKNLGKGTETELQGKYKGNVFFKQCDVSKDDELEGAFVDTIQKYGHLDILCNNAGIANEKDWRMMMNINLGAVVQGTLLAFKYMGKAAGRESGTVVNTASSAGVLPHPLGPMYAAFKHGVVGFTKSVGLLSPGKYGVTVNCVCPHLTNTPILTTGDDIGFADGDVKGFIQHELDEHGMMEPSEVAECMKRLVETKDMSASAMFVCPKTKEIIPLPMSIPALFGK